MAGWKRYCADYKRAVRSNIAANQHYLQGLFRKSLQAARMHSKLGYQQLVFDRLRRATLSSIREVLHSRSILLTMRKRIALHAIVKTYRYRKRILRALQVSLRYKGLTLQKKYFSLLKAGTLLEKLRAKHDVRLLREACAKFVGRLKLTQ